MNATLELNPNPSIWCLRGVTVPRDAKKTESAVRDSTRKSNSFSGLKQVSPCSKALKKSFNLYGSTGASDFIFAKVVRDEEGSVGMAEILFFIPIPRLIAA